MLESAKEKTDRQLIELLNELRVALPGGQVLLGFLLTAPFATRFGRTTAFERSIFFACTLVTGLGVLLLMAPSVYHRLRWQRGGKEDVIRIGHELFLVGTGCLALGLLCAVFLVGDVLYGTAAAVPALAVLLVIVVGIWYLLPLRRGQRPGIRAEE